MGDSRHTPNIPINTVIGENEKCVFYFMEKKVTDFLANPIHLPLLKQLCTRGPTTIQDPGTVFLMLLGLRQLRA